MFQIWDIVHTLHQNRVWWQTLQRPTPEAAQKLMMWQVDECAGALIRAASRAEEDLAPALPPRKRAYLLGSLGQAAARTIMWMLPDIPVRARCTYPANLNQFPKDPEPSSVRPSAARALLSREWSWPNQALATLLFIQLLCRSGLHCGGWHKTCQGWWCTAMHGIYKPRLQWTAI